MWIFTTSGFASAVMDRDDHSKMYVRSRERHHLEALFPGDPIIDSVETNIGSDYRYRVHVPRERVAQVVSDYVMGTKASNFKDAVKAAETAQGRKSSEYEFALHGIWRELAATQDPRPYTWGVDYTPTRSAWQSDLADDLGDLGDALDDLGDLGADDADGADGADDAFIDSVVENVLALAATNPGKSAGWLIEEVAELMGVDAGTIRTALVDGDLPEGDLTLL